MTDNTDNEADIMPDDVKDYWMIQVNSVEGYYLVDKIARLTKLKDAAVAARAMLMVMTEAGSTIFLLKRSLVPAHLIASILGASEEAVSKTTKVIKVLMDKPPGLPSPTVLGWGEA